MRLVALIGLALLVLVSTPAQARQQHDINASAINPLEMWQAER